MYHEIEGTTARIQVGAARLSLAKMPRGRHDGPLEAALVALEVLWDSVSGDPQRAAQASERFHASVQDDDQPADQWPSWCDDDRWTLADDDLASDDDLAAEVVPYQPTQTDLEEYARWSEWMESQPRVEWMDYMEDLPPMSGGTGSTALDRRLAELADGTEYGGRLTDADIQAAGGAVG